MNRYAKGRRAEYRAQRILEAGGFDAMRIAGSKGTWDIVAVGPSVRLVQVKSNCQPTREEIEGMQDYRVPQGVSKEIWLFKDRVREPVIRFV